MYPNRLVALATAVLGVLAAVAVPLANLDWSSTAGVIAGLGAAALAASKWLDGWQKHEQREATTTFVVPEQDQGDAGAPDVPAKPKPATRRPATRKKRP